MSSSIKSSAIKDDTLVILALTIFTFLLRIPQLSSPLVIDEAITFNRYRNVPWQNLLLNYYDTNQHTLFSLLSNLSIWLFGENELAFRLPSFLAGILAIPLLYKLGIYFFKSKPTAIISCCLLALSMPHFNYSQDGRGYSLTVFLSLLLIYSAIQIVRNNEKLIWGASLSVSGLCLILTLPSNAFFLSASGIFCLILIWDLKKEANSSFKNNFCHLAISYLIMLALISAYLFIVYEGLKKGVDHHAYAKLSLEKYYKISQFIVSPLGSWFYIPLLYGWINLNSKKLKLCFCSLLITPLFLTLITDIIGFARIYIYYLPFAFLLIAFGLVHFFNTLISYNKKIASTLSVALFFGVLIQPAFAINDYYFKKNNSITPSIAESKKLLKYVSKEIPLSNLIFTLGEDIMVSHFIISEILKRTERVLKGEKINKINFLTNRKSLLHIDVIKTFYSGTIELPIHFFKLVKKIGPVKVYELQMKNKKLIPSLLQPDYETKINFIGNSKNVSLSHTTSPKLINKKALLIKKQDPKEVFLQSTSTKNIEIKNQNSFLLFSYAQKFGQKSNAMLTDIKAVSLPSIMILNPYMGVLPPTNKDFAWEMVFTLSVLSPGNHKLSEALHLRDTVSHFDVLQSHILYP